MRAPPRPSTSTILGALLVLLGLVWLAAQFLNVDVGRFGWPFFVIIPGIVVIALALVTPDRGGLGLAILGSILTVNGVLLLYQNSTNHWESWAYAWALVFPGSIGLGQILFGASTGRRDLVRTGTRVLTAGLTLFLVGAVFFEGVIGISGRQFGRVTGVTFAAILIGFGVILLLANLVSARRTSR